MTQEDAHGLTRREHVAIAQAICDRQPSIAAALSIAHTSRSENWIRNSLAEEQ